MVRLQGFVTALCLTSAVQASWTQKLQKRNDINDCLEAADVPFHVEDTEAWDIDASPFNLRLNYTPAAIAVPRSIKHIQSAVLCGLENEVRVSPKGGGHSYASLGFGGESGQLVIELDRMNNVTLHDDNTATIQGGTRLGKVALELYNQGERALSHGTCPGVGLGGHSLHGGYGFASHTHGLTLDWMIGATVVLADGSVVHCSETEHSDLFWALRGAGGGFGIVAEFEFNTFAAPEIVTVFTVSTRWNETQHVRNLKKLQDWAVESMPHELNMRLNINANSISWEGNFYGTKAELTEALGPIMNATNATFSMTRQTDWIGQAQNWVYGHPMNQTVPYDVHEKFYSTSLTAPYLSDKAIKDFVSYKYHNATVRFPRGWWVQWDFHGGANSAVTSRSNSETAYAHRDQLFLWQFYDSIYDNSAYPKNGFSLLQGFAATIENTFEEGEYGKYINYADTQLTKEEAEKLYYRGNIGRLREIKKKYDPTEVFWNPASVSPAK